MKGRECSIDSKISETRLAVRSNQDVVLGIVGHQHAGLPITSVCLPE